MGSLVVAKCRFAIACVVLCCVLVFCLCIIFAVLLFAAEAEHSSTGYRYSTVGTGTEASSTAVSSTGSYFENLCKGWYL